MDISSIVSSLVSESSRSRKQGDAGTTELAAAAFKKASDRVERQLSSTQVQISAFGQIQGAFSEVQAAAKPLGDTKLTTGALKTAIATFVAAFNSANKAVITATKGSATQTGTLANNVRAASAGRDLQGSLSEGSTLADLSKIGITQSKDGSLAIDAKALESALQSNPSQVRSTVARVGSRAEKAVATELASGGNVGGSLNSLNARNRSLEAQRSSQQAQVASAQRLVDQQTSQIDSISKLGIAAYLKIFTG